MWAPCWRRSLRPARCTARCAGARRLGTPQPRARSSSRATLPARFGKRRTSHTRPVRSTPLTRTRFWTLRGVVASLRTSGPSAPPRPITAGSSSLERRTAWPTRPRATLASRVRGRPTDRTQAGGVHQLIGRTGRQGRPTNPSPTHPPWRPSLRLPGSSAPAPAASSLGLAPPLARPATRQAVLTRCAPSAPCIDVFVQATSCRQDI